MSPPSPRGVLRPAHASQTYPARGCVWAMSMPQPRMMLGQPPEAVQAAQYTPMQSVSQSDEHERVKERTSHVVLRDYGQGRRGQRVELHVAGDRGGRHEDPAIAGGAEHARAGALRAAARGRTQDRSAGPLGDGGELG